MHKTLVLHWSIFVSGTLIAASDYSPCQIHWDKGTTPLSQINDLDDDGHSSQVTTGHSFFLTNRHDFLSFVTSWPRTCFSGTDVKVQRRGGCVSCFKSPTSHTTFIQRPLVPLPLLSERICWHGEHQLVWFVFLLAQHETPRPGGINKLQSRIMLISHSYFHIVLFQLSMSQLAFCSDCLLCGCWEELLAGELNLLCSVPWWCSGAFLTQWRQGAFRDACSAHYWGISANSNSNASTIAMTDFPLVATFWTNW